MRSTGPAIGRFVPGLATAKTNVSVTKPLSPTPEAQVWLYLEVLQDFAQASSFPSARGTRDVEAAGFLPADVFFQELLDEVCLFLSGMESIGDSRVQDTFHLLVTTT